MYDKRILSERVAEDIRQMILTRNLQPGDKLLNEIEMTHSLNVSRSTLREAIKTLVSQNILEVHRGRGTFVSNQVGVAKDPLGISFMEEEDLITYFFEVRLMIEPQMAEMAALRGNQEDHDKIYAAYEQVKRLIKASENHTEADIDFHNEIAQATHNPILQRIVPIINDGIVGGYKRTKDNPESAEVVLEQHRLIMTAIKERNSKKARKAMEAHILYGLNQSR